MAAKVRMLEWKPAGYHGQSLEASAFGISVAYRVSGKPGDWTLTSLGATAYVHTPGYETRAAAQAAAQVDFQRRVIAELTPAADAAKTEVVPCLTDAEQRDQAGRCLCKGSDEYCPCQNTLDRRTIEGRQP